MFLFNIIWIKRNKYQ